MHFLNSFYLTTIKYYLINKFVYKKINVLPKLNKIILNFDSKKMDNKKILSGLLMFELITNQKGYILKTGVISVLVSKGNPVGYKLTLKKQKLFNLFSNLLIDTTLLFNNNLFKLNKNTISLKINDTFSFFKLETHYYFFNLLSNLNVTIVATTKNKKETVFFYKLFYFKIDQSKLKIKK
jgi:ribosomal protein L5